MRKCRKCGEEKELDEFGKHTTAGVTRIRHICKPCRVLESKEYSKTEKGKATRDRYLSSDKGRATCKASNKAYAESPQGIANAKKNRSKRLKNAKNYRENNREKLLQYKRDYYHSNIDEQNKQLIRCILNNAINDCAVLRPEKCDCCNNTNPQGHHFSYEVEDALKVAWLCDKCHKETHVFMRRGFYQTYEEYQAVLEIVKQIK